MTTNYMAHKVTDKRIIAFMMRKMKFWEPVKYGKKTYYMTFQHNVFEKVSR